LITEKKIQEFIEKVPPVPKTLQATLQLLDAGELVKASKIAKTDLALSAFLKDLVNKPIYGFKNEVADVSQIFGILGVARSQQAVYTYMMSLLSPDKWEFFQLNKKLFNNLQAELSASWHTITTHLGIEDKEVQSAIALLPASIIVSEALFCEKKEDVLLLRSVNEIDLSTILYRLTGKTLFDLCEDIAKKWGMNPKIITLVHLASAQQKSDDEELEKLGKWMHLLLFYYLSKPQYIEAGLNDFLNFEIDFVADIYDEFAQVMEIA
jgi:HD-like signal output (HDOD) protein